MNAFLPQRTKKFFKYSQDTTKEERTCRTLNDKNIMSVYVTWVGPMNNIKI